MKKIKKILTHGIAGMALRGKNRFCEIIAICFFLNLFSCVFGDKVDFYWIINKKNYKILVEKVNPSDSESVRQNINDYLNKKARMSINKDDSLNISYSPIFQKNDNIPNEEGIFFCIYNLDSLDYFIVNHKNISEFKSYYIEFFSKKHLEETNYRVIIK